MLSLAFVFPLAACGGNGGGGGGGSNKLLEENLIEDQYDNYYEIFVRSFYDSDGNGTGDLKGVTEKLPYVRDMGYTGIWLMPINPTDSYHGYDVRDYKAINPTLGTLEDFRDMVEEAHRLGIKVIIDLVLNHSSNNHPWFKAACQAFISGDRGNQYYDYYNFSQTKKDGYRQYGNIWAEARFADSMPDINLDSANVRAEFQDIIKYWIEDENVDGFRLDAVRYFYYGDSKRSSEFTGLIKEWADAAYKEAHPDEPNGAAFIVGEDWAGSGEIKTFFANAKGANFFDFQCQGSNGYVDKAVSSAMLRDANPAGTANDFFNTLSSVLSKAQGNTPCPFLDNHDVARIAGIEMKEEVRIKFAYGLLSLYTGSNFTYYGDEIGMTGSANDPEKRVGMLWAKDTVGIYPPGATRDPSRYYPFPSVEEQLADKNSILNYYKLCNNARNAFPALMRGTFERVENENENVLVFTKTYKEETITIAVNFASSVQTVKGLGNLSLKQGICVSGSVSGSGASLKLPAYGIAILA